MSHTRVLTLVGSLRSASVNRRLAETAAAVAPAGVDVQVYEALAEVPFYNEDLDAGTGVPAAAVALRAAAREAHALLLVTPEYNGSIPAVLKNAIDWLSRPYGAGALAGKPVAVIGASPSVNGAKWALAETVKALGVAGARTGLQLSVASTADRFGDTHPRDDVEVAEQITALLTRLAGARNELVDA